MNHPALPHLSDLSPLRIGAFSTALGLHLVAFGLLLLPMRALDTPPRAVTPEAIVAEFIANVVLRPEPVPPVPKPPVRPTPTPRATPVAATVPVLLAESALAVEAESAATDVAESAERPAVPSQAAQIAYDQASPPPYPGFAQRRGWEGTVLLRVRVDSNGRPREVSIERSSGHALLDRSATDHVLAHWRFRPALHNGQPVPAWARVPISFTLSR